MASSVTLPTFEDEEILLYEKLNAMVDAIDAKFAAGIGAADIAWPLTAEGNLDMSTFEIINGKKIWGIVNADEYGSGTDALALAVAAAGVNGVTLVPPGVTLTSAETVTLPAGASIIGSGPGSVLQLASGASHGSLLNATSTSGHFISNIKLDGLAETGSGQEGITFAGVTNSIINKVHFQDFSGGCLEVTSTSDNVIVSDCFFDDSVDGVYVTQCNRLFLSNCSFDSQSNAAVRLECTSESTPIRAHLSNIRISNPADKGLLMLGANAPGGASAAEIHITNMLAQSLGSGAGVQLGSAAASVGRVTWAGGNINGGSADSIVVNATWGNISNVIVTNTTDTCLDLDISTSVHLSNCIFQDGTLGVDGGDCAGLCTAADCKFTACTTDMVLSSNFTQYNCSPDHPGSPNFVGRMYFDSALAASTTETVTTITIPADTLRVGSCLEVFAYGDWNNGGAALAAAISLRVGANNFVFSRYSDGEPWAMKGELYIVTASGVNGRGFGFGGATIGTDDTIFESIVATNITFDQTAAQTIGIYYLDSGAASVTLEGWGWKVSHVDVIDSS